jgi:nucleotide-binding universal stress UspA family protein
VTALDLMLAMDFSPHGNAVLRVARRFGRTLDAKVWIVHAVSPAVGVASCSGGRRDRVAAGAEIREERRLVDEAAANLRESGVNADALLVQGPPAKVVLDEARRLEVDMIIIGSHGYGAVARALLGSVSAGVVRHAQCPVLVVPATKKSH